MICDVGVLQSALKTLMVIHRLMRESGGTAFVKHLVTSHYGGSAPGGGNFSAAGQNGMGNAATGIGSGTGTTGMGRANLSMKGRLLNMDNFVDQTNSDGR